METETLQTEKSYPVKEFLDSLSKAVKQLEAQRTGVVPSQAIFDKISKQSEMKKKREQLKQRVELINEIACSHTYDFEELCNELVKSGELSVSFFLDGLEYDLLNQ